ncbi:hypothetical protein A2U01_0040116 [Trifolium medium]|uniref:Uncharacterized protein n=1 Tax=Trifolium medium TaxID=97028 RepID=A0A392Q3R9_9FABA|nr:hypothetical protein [Trifolium medium]
MVDMRYTKEDDNTDSWAAKYEIGEKLDRVVYIRLEVKHDKNGVENIHVVLGDEADNETNILVNITLVGGGGGLHGGITNIISSGAYSTFISNEQDYSIETNIISYDCSYRDGLFVLHMKKINYSDDIAYMAAMAQYYITKTVGLYAVTEPEILNCGGTIYIILQH